MMSASGVPRGVSITASSNDGDGPSRRDSGAAPAIAAENSDSSTTMTMIGMVRMVGTRPLSLIAARHPPAGRF